MQLTQCNLHELLVEVGTLSIASGALNKTPEARLLGGEALEQEGSNPIAAHEQRRLHARVRCLAAVLLCQL